MRPLIASLAAGLLLTGTAMADAAAADGKVSFHIPKQPLNLALTALAQQADLRIVFDTSTAEKLTAPALDGAYTTNEALKKLLEPAGLRADYLDNKTVAIRLVKESESRNELTGPHQNAPQPPDKNDDKLDEIVVTGTHIRGTDTRVNPVITIDRAQIERSGYSSTQELFRSLPQSFQNADASEDGWLNAASGNNIEFGSGVDLRGLGPSSTLVLLNGHRLAPSAHGSFVDVSAIPLSAIDKVEILTDGSSAIYGSDAVSGVVNIILKKDYQGADTTLRYGATTEGGRDEFLAAQTLGTHWSGGNVVGTLQFQRQGALPARYRPDSASALTVPNDLFPRVHSYAATLVGRQSLTDRLDFYGDILAAKREPSLFGSNPVDPVNVINVANIATSESISVSPGLSYSLSPAWTVDLNGLFSYQKSLADTQLVAPPAVSFYDLHYDLNNRFTEKSLDLAIQGPLLSTTAGDIAIAFGGSYRRENFTNLVTYQFASGPVSQRIDVDRRITAEFVELHIPLVGAANAIPGVQALEMSAAVRRDRYSDFGPTTNPHLGLRWAPVADLSLRATYGRSFRAPDASELAEASYPVQLIGEDVLSPTGSGTVPVFILAGSKPLRPERARTLNFGVEYQPEALQGFKASLDYYDILFNNRIITPIPSSDFLQRASSYGSVISPIASDAAAQGVVDAITASGGQYYDETLSGTGVAGVRYLFDNQEQNAAKVRQTGLDLAASLAKTLGANVWTSQIDVAYINKLKTTFSPGAPVLNQLNTFGNPVKWKSRLQSTWASPAYSISGALNVVGSYTNTNAAGNPPISAWTTLDLNATLNAGAFLSGWRDVSLSVVLLNAFNRDPPFVKNLNAINPANYDSVNASAVGRIIAVSVRKKW